MKRYNPKDIEPRWQQKWADQKIYQADDASAKPKKYILEYFPYPSGAAMHVGHVRNYAIGDALARHARMNGHNVLYAMGWDAFGLPAENYAIKNNISPQQAIAENTTKFKRQLTQMGFSYDWSRELNSSDPGYYKWTQWFFLLLHKRGLAYQKESMQWWCPVDKTVLANEQVENGRCWRCDNPVEKKALKQWFFKITDYADRLEKDLDDVNWSHALKTMQRNWIGRSRGAEVYFKIDGQDEKLQVFTTRPDTLFGATFMVLAPEHPLAKTITTPKHSQEVNDYIQATQAKSEIERQETEREKTGVFTGAFAINPVNQAKIPIWIADYVLAGYGTGAIMAVPAHDQRDWEFAQKFELPIKQVVMGEHIDQLHPTLPNLPLEERTVAQTIVKHPTEDKYLMLRLKGWKTETYSLPIGGVDDGEDIAKAAMRELGEETGYTDHGEVTEAGAPYFAQFYHELKKVNRRAKIYTMCTQLKSLKQADIAEEEAANHEVMWVSLDELHDKLHGQGVQEVVDLFRQGGGATAGEGIMINSGPYDGLPASQARDKIVADLATKQQAKERINYKIRDWLISRQRYWGAPIPMIHCQKCGTVPVPEDQLPVELPPMDSYEPSGDGRSPLARVSEFVNTTCPKCGGPAERETDTMDGFACSSWYFLRFLDPHNNDQPADPDKVKYWMPVDDYIGGAEHAVMHLLYVRFWFKVMYDEGLVDFSEPIKTLRNHGMILAPDGQKMSKSKGNTIEPDFLIEQGYGADTIRVMELFIGPWNQKANWSVEGMGGCFRFLQRVWTITQEFLEASTKAEASPTSEKLLLTATHRTIKKVTEDLHDMGFNTAIASLMEFTNELYKIKAEHGFAGKAAWQFALTSLQQLLAPFAPHITEELWQDLGQTTSVHTSTWPTWDDKFLQNDTMTIVVQVNGKVRANITVPTGAAKETIIQTAKTDPRATSYLTTIKKTIYVPNKLINFVVGL